MLRFKNGIGLHCILASAYFLMLPLTIATNSVGASFLKIASLPIGLYFVISLLFYRQEFQINVVHIALAVFTLGTAATLFVANDRASVIMVFGYFLNAALYISLSVVVYNEKELKIFEYVQVALLVIITILTLMDNTIGESGRETLTIFGFASDPNYFVGYIIFPLAVTLEKIVKSRRRLFFIVVAAAGIYAVFLSGSRGGLLAVIVTIIAFALIYPKGIFKKFMIMALLVGGLVVMWVLLSPMLPEHVFERMSIEAVLETRGTYRGDIWISMLNEIKDSSWEIIFGRGIDAQHVMMIMGKRSPVFAHNYFIQLLYNQGIVGLILFVLLAAACMLRCVRKRKYVTIAMIGMLTLTLGLSINPSIKTLWNLIPYAAFSFLNGADENENENEIKGGVITNESRNN